MLNKRTCSNSITWSLPSFFKCFSSSFGVFLLLLFFFVLFCFLFLFFFLEKKSRGKIKRFLLMPGKHHSCFFSEFVLFLCFVAVCGPSRLTQLACQRHIFCWRKKKKKKCEYCWISPKEVLLLLTVGYSGPRWSVCPVRTKFLEMGEYLHVLECGRFGGSFPLTPFSLVPCFPHHSKDVRRSYLTWGRECFC